MTNARPRETARNDEAATIRVVDEGARFSLRADHAALADASRAFGVPLPAAIGSVRRDAEREALCVGPDEWTLTAPETEHAAIAAAFAELAHPVSLVDISDRELTIHVRGSRAADLIAAGCPIDIERLPEGGATRTVFDGAMVTLRRDRVGAFRLEASRSLTPHVVAVLRAANDELAAGL